MFRWEAQDVAAELSLQYGGPALDEGEMSVRDLAPALLAFADVVAAANAVANPGTMDPRVSIKGQPRQGSFIVDMILTDPGVMSRVRDLFTGDGAGTVVNARGLAALISGSLLLITQAGGRILRSRDQTNDGQVTLTFTDGTTLTTAEAQAEVAFDADFRYAARALVRPVNQEGVDYLSIDSRADGQRPIRIESSDIPAFDPPPTEDDLLVDTEYETLLNAKSVAFQAGHKWRVSEGSDTYWVTINDLDFLQRVDTGQEDFRSGDRFRVRLRLRQWEQQDGTLKSQRAVVRVLEHIRGPRQSPLAFPGDGG